MQLGYNYFGQKMKANYEFIINKNFKLGVLNNGLFVKVKVL